MSRQTIFLILFCMVTLQGILTYFQIKNYNKTIIDLKKLGKVGIGNIRGKLSKGIVVLLCVNEKNETVKILKMEGISVFARFKEVNKYTGVTLNELFVESQNALQKNENRNFYKALISARKLKTRNSTNL